MIVILKRNAKEQHPKVVFCLYFHIRTHTRAHIQQTHAHTRVHTYNLITSTCRVILTPIPAKWGLFCILYFHIKILAESLCIPIPYIEYSISLILKYFLCTVGPSCLPLTQIQRWLAEQGRFTPPHSHRLQLC